MCIRKKLGKKLQFNIKTFHFSSSSKAKERKKEKKKKMSWLCDKRRSQVVVGRRVIEGAGELVREPHHRPTKRTDDWIYDWCGRCQRHQPHRPVSTALLFFFIITIFFLPLFLLSLSLLDDRVFFSPSPASISFSLPSTTDPLMIDERVWHFSRIFFFFVLFRSTTFFFCCRLAIKVVKK